MQLNDEQQIAVDTIEGPVLILAGAGSGKTRVLTNRIAHLIADCDVNPYNILAITFTNKAAKEMRERVDDLVGFGSEDVWVSTFHSLCLRVLFRFADRLGYDTNFEICDTSDQKSVIKDVCKKLNIDTKMIKEKTILNAISNAKDELIDPVLFREMNAGDLRNSIIADAYSEYQRTLKKNNSFDFDDMIMKTVELFKEHPDVLAFYQERFKFIMVDEYQDTNTAQFELIRLLADRYKNLCVVGDDDQSIYKFRGANIRNILDFELVYPNARVIKLEQNYRSSQIILDAANAVISNNVGRKSKALWTEAERGKKIHFKQLDSASSEAMYVAEKIEEAVEKYGIHYGDCAILMRTNVQSKEFEDAFRIKGIDYELVKGLRFWDTKVIKDLCAYLSTVASGLNDVRTSRIINVPKRGIGNTTVEKLLSYAAMRGCSLMEACEICQDVPGLGKAADKIEAFSNMIFRIRAKMPDISFTELLDEIINETDYMAYLDSEADTKEKYDEMVEYIDKLRETLQVYEDSTENPDIIDFMRQNGLEGNNLDKSLDGAQTGIDELSAEKMREMKERKVLIMTMHNAKGLEFPCVFLVGMEDGLFPSYMTITGDDPSEMEEERRLCYVGITRAKDYLTITCARQRMVNGETRFSKTSRFVKEIPLSLIDMSLPKEKVPERDRIEPSALDAAKRAYERKPYQTQGLVKRKAAMPGFKKLSEMVAEKPDYAEGDRVCHIKFGEGTVLSLQKGSRDYEVSVNFDEYGIKNMLAGFAKLKKV